jgi:hypothetical protein
LGRKLALRRRSLDQERLLARRRGVLDGLLLKEHELAESSAALQRRIEDYRVRLELARARDSAAGGANPPADPSARK